VRLVAIPIRARGGWRPPDSTSSESERTLYRDMSQRADANEFPAVDEPLHRLSVTQYRRMAETGVLTPDDRVELLEGLLVEKMTKNPPHRIANRRARVSLEAVVPPRWYVDAQEPIVTTDSEPEPDVVVVRGRTEDYRDSNPRSENVGLVVEIADVSLLRDRRLKGRIYARAGIPVYWIVNLVDRSVEVYTAPDATASPPSYSLRADHGADATLPLILDGVEVARVCVADLLP
jgi:Uma2 family endonuclease